MIACVCAQCGKNFEKSLTQIKKSKNNFCSSKCSATFDNAVRYADEKNLRILNCLDCKIEIKTYSPRHKGICNICKKHNSYIKNKEIPKCIISQIGDKYEISCQRCKNIFLSSYSTRRTCNICNSEIGRIGGVKSAQIRNKRSKNEIYFAELCQQAFGNVSCNELYFSSSTGKWDADVILHDYKVAVLWNGIWHYQQVNKSHSLKLVQSRDKIKIKVITDNGYIPYVIKDMGKYNRNFVEEQFNKLKKYFLNVSYVNNI